MCGAPFVLKRSYTNLNVVDSFKKKNNKKNKNNNNIDNWTHVLLRRRRDCSWGNIFHRNPCSLDCGRWKKSRKRKHFVFHPPQTNGEGGGTPTPPQVKGLQRNLKYKHFLNIFFSWFLGLCYQEVLWCQALLFSVATLWFGIVWFRMT